MENSDNKVPVLRAIALGIFLVLFGFTLGVLTFATLVGPIFGLLLIGLGIYFIWSSVTTREPPDPLK